MDNYKKSSQITKISPIIDENLAYLKTIFGTGIGLIGRKYYIKSGVQVGLVYIDSITDKKVVGSQIVEPLLKANIDFSGKTDDILMIIHSRVIFAPDTREIRQMKDIVDNLIKGYTVIFVEGVNNALIIKSRKIEKRAIEKPLNEVTSLGSMDSLTEDIDTNCNLINRRLPIPSLRFERFTVGKLSRTEVKLLWIEGVASTKIIEEAKSRIQKINMDVVDGIGVLSELIIDTPSSIFTMYKQTQRPDVIAKSLSDGQFAVLCNNSPYALIAPITFWDNFKTMDDYSETPASASYLRLARYTAFILAVTVSPLYLAFVAYNHSIVPPTLALNIASGREGVPFPSIVEILVLSFGITIIREASLRIPGSIGYFIGALAAIVIGQSAVNAGYVSAAVIIVVAVSNIGAYAISSTTILYTTRIINYILIILAGTFGMFGLINGVVVIAWYMCSLESFSVPYLYPVIPFNIDGMKDTIIRLHFSFMKRRMRMLAPFNRVRMNEKDN